MDSIREWFRSQGLTRSADRRVLGGVCAGLGRRLGIEPWPSRLLFVLVLLLIPGSQILLYPILWILMPVQQPGDLPVQPAVPSTGPSAQPL